MGSTSPMATMSGMADMSSLGPKGCSMQMMFKPGFNASSLPPETCSNTTSELFMFNVDASQGWTAFHLVNAAAVSRLSVSLHVRLCCRRALCEAARGQGATRLDRSAVFSDGETRSDAWKLLPAFCFVSLRRYAASHRRSSNPVIPD